jgi:acyl carrier protein
VSIGTDGILTLLELAPEFDGDLGRFALHPALMDLASAAGRLHTGESYYLPLCYRALRLHRPLTGRVWCWIKPTDTREGDRETVTWNIDLLDDDGTSLVEVEEFTIKRINDPHAFRDVAAPAAEAPSGPIVPVATPAPDTGAATRAGDGIAPADGATAFARLLERGEAPRMVVSTRELRAAIARARTLTLAEVARALEASVAPAARHPRPGLATPYVAPRTDLERQLAEIWQDVLGIDGVGVEDGFFELGGHSLLAIQTISRIRDSLRVQLPIRRFFEGPTVAAMAEMVARSRVDGDDGAIPRLDRGDAEDVLRRIDELSDEEVDAMLRAEDAETTAGE